VAQFLIRLATAAIDKMNRKKEKNEEKAGERDTRQCACN